LVKKPVTQPVTLSCNYIEITGRIGKPTIRLHVFSTKHYDIIERIVPYRCRLCMVVGIAHYLGTLHFGGVYIMRTVILAYVKLAT